MNDLSQMDISGIRCPGCGKDIPFTLSELLTACCLCCPVCHIEMTVNLKESHRLLKALQSYRVRRKYVVTGKA